MRILAEMSARVRPVARRARRISEIVIARSSVAIAPDASVRRCGDSDLSRWWLMSARTHSSGFCRGKTLERIGKLHERGVGRQVERSEAARNDEPECARDTGAGAEPRHQRFKKMHRTRDLMAVGGDRPLDRDGT